MMRYTILIFMFSVLVISCGKPTKENKTEQTTENVEKVSVEIAGMTCEMGCAKLIESKLAKKQGVKNAEVSFKDSTGIILFDKNTISQKEIVSTIEKIADGELYKVKKVTQIN